MKKIYILLIVVAFLFPQIGFAATVQELQTQIQALLQQIELLQQQIQDIQQTETGSASGTPTVINLPDISHNLYVGARDVGTGGDVTRLQKFLAQDPTIYPEGLVTGYYGQLTEMAVKRWQCRHNVVCGGTLRTTGYGAFGPKSRTALKEVHVNENTPVVPPTSLNQSRTQTPATSQTQIQTIPSCTSFTYSSWSVCQSNNLQTRSVISSFPTGCSGGSPATTRSCGYIDPTQNPDPTQPFLRISKSPDSPDGTKSVVAGSLQETLSVYDLDADESGEDINISSMKFTFSASSLGRITDLTNCAIYSGINKLTTGANIIHPYSTGSHTFNFDSPFVVPKGGQRSLSLKCDVGATALSSYGLSLTEPPQATGASNASVQIRMGTIYSGVNVISNGTLRVALGASTPSSGKSVLAGSTDVVAVVLKFSAEHEDINLSQVGLSFKGTDEKAVKRVTLWDGNIKKADDLSPFTSDRALVTLSQQIPIPVGSSKEITVKVDLANIGDIGSVVGSFPRQIQAGDYIQINYDGTSSRGNGQTSGVVISSQVGASPPFTGAKNITLTAAPNLSPTISLTQGPTNLAMQQVGTWIVSGSDPEGGAVTLSVNWGDGSIPEEIVGSVNPSHNFTHAYTQAGDYQATFSGTDSGGLQAQITLDIKVVDTSQGAVLLLTSPDGGESLQVGVYHTIKWTGSEIGGFGEEMVNIDIVNFSGGGSVSTNISSGVPNYYAYDWLVPASVTAGNQYKIKVSIPAKNVEDLSDGFFSVTD